MPLKELREKAFTPGRKDKRNAAWNEFTESRAFLPLPAPVQFYGFDDTDLSIPPYMLGVWLGDGHSANGRITSADPEIFQWFDCPITKQSGEYLYKAEGLSTRLKELGVIDNKHVPGLYLVGKPVQRLALLQGLMDTDGTIHQDGKIAYFCNTNEGLIESVVFIVRSLGGIASVSTTKSAKGASKTSWRVSVKLPLEWCPFRLSRKASKWVGSVGMKLPIKEIVPAGTMLARCITVEAKDGLYVTDDFILTHNSTALTLAYGLAVVLFREQDYVIILGSSEDMAVESLGELSLELAENEDIRRDFGIRRFVVEQKTDIIVECDDGHQFRVIGRGAGQKIRGRKWRGKRPGLIIFDDVEDDEQVESREQRVKFRRWFFRAAKQAVRIGGKVRGHGTILHEDSMLANLMKNTQWHTRLYKAHAGFDDFTQILWPQRFTEKDLRAKRQELIEAHDAAGYSAELLNDPLDNSEAFIRSDDFIPMTEGDYDAPKKICVAADFAVSKADAANRTSFTVGGKCIRNLVHHLDFRVGRWDPVEWINVMFEIQQRWSPEIFFVEDGVIWKAVKRMVYEEMQKRDLWINIEAILPVKDKATRGRPFQKRMRAGGCRWDARATGFEGAKQEILRFTGTAQATLDDQFDSAALLSRGFEFVPLIEEEDFDTDEDMDMRKQDPRRNDGRSRVTGY